MLPRNLNAKHSALFLNYTTKTSAADLKFGETLESRVLQVFANGRVLVDLKGKPTIAAANVPMKAGTVFLDKVRRSGRQKWLQIIDNNTNSTLGDFERILKKMGFSPDELNKTILKVLAQHKIEPNCYLIKHIHENVQKFKRFVSDQWQLVECVAYLTSINLEINQESIFSAMTLLGSDYMLGEKLEQIRHYIAVSQRNLRTNDVQYLTNTIAKIPLILPGCSTSFMFKPHDSLPISSDGSNLIEEVQSVFHCSLTNWIDILKDARDKLSTSGKAHLRSLSLVDQSIRLAESLKLFCKKRGHDYCTTFLYFQIPVSFENRYSTIEGRIMPSSDLDTGSNVLEFEAIWKSGGQSKAYFKLSNDVTSWDIKVKTANDMLSGMFKREFHELPILKDNESDVSFQIGTDDSFVQENTGDLRWNPNLYVNKEIEVVV